MGGQSRPQPMTMGMQQATNPIPADRFGQMMTPQPMTQAQSPYAVLQESPAVTRQPSGPTGAFNNTLGNFQKMSFQPAPTGDPGFNTLPSSGPRSFAGPIGRPLQPYFGSGLFGGNSGGMPQGPQFPSMGGGMCGGGRQY